MKGKKSRLKTTLILSGGGAKGAIQVGALKVILNKIKPDYIIGTSIGAVNGAFISTGTSIEELEKIWLNVKKRNLLSFNFGLLFRFYISESLYTNKKWYKWLNKQFGNQTFAKCKIPLYINATKLQNGKEVFFHRGSLVDAIMASTALPPVLPPYDINGTRYIDGGISSNIATAEVIKLKSEQIIIINLAYSGKPEHYEKGIFHLAYHALDLMSYHSFKKDLELCQLRKGSKKKNIVIIEPNHAFNVLDTDLSQIPRMIKEGEKEAKKYLKKIIV
ncbi:MAG: patatin-like phospholipase family protein [archaeon]|nr:patatin-like phospholipase family protein [Nanoarchaeota archaeon]